jgi:hypothetical protein
MRRVDGYIKISTTVLFADDCSILYPEVGSKFADINQFATGKSMNLSMYLSVNQFAADHSIYDSIYLI